MSGKASSFNLTLIAAYRQHPMLFDNRHRDYKVQNPTKEAWAEVAKVCNSTPDECRARWKALRDRFIKERKKKHANPLYKVAWPLYHKMEFLEPFIEHAHKKGLRAFHAHAFSEMPRRAIENVLEVLVREAQGSSLLHPHLNFDGENKDSNTSSSSNSGGRPDTIDFSPTEEGHELEKFYLKLIRKVRQHQLLFDSSHSMYRVTAARNRVWEDIAASFGEGYTASELRTKWRSIRDRYIRERRLYKESVQEGKPRLPKWSLYPEFAFLDFYVDQTFPRSYTAHDNNLDAESVHSGDQPMHVDTEEADQSSPSSTSSTPSTTAEPHPSTSMAGLGNAAMLQMLQRMMQGGGASLNPAEGALAAADPSSSALMNNLSALVQSRGSRLRPAAASAAASTIFASHTPISTSTLAEGVTDVLADLQRCVVKLSGIAQDISENGLEYSFGHYVAGELLRTAEPRRSEVRRAILALLSAESKVKLEGGGAAAGEERSASAEPAAPAKPAAGLALPAGLAALSP